MLAHLGETLVPKGVEELLFGAHAIGGAVNFVVNFAVVVGLPLGKQLALDVLNDLLLQGAYAAVLAETGQGPLDRGLVDSVLAQLAQPSVPTNVLGTKALVFVSVD